MNPSKPITEDQLLGLLKVIAAVAARPELFEPLKLTALTGGVTRVNPVSQTDFEGNIKTVQGLARYYGVLK